MTQSCPFAFLRESFLKGLGFYPDFTDTSKKPVMGKKECLCQSEEDTAPSSNEAPMNKSLNRVSTASLRFCAALGIIVQYCASPSGRIFWQRYALRVSNENT